MRDTSPTLETAFESLLRRIFREEFGAIKAELNGNQLLSAKAAADRWEVPESWIRDMARRGELPCVHLGHYVRFKREDLDQFVSEHRK